MIAAYLPRQFRQLAPSVLAVLLIITPGLAAAEPDEAEPPADIGLVFEHAYASPPASLAEELAELREVLGE